MKKSVWWDKKRNEREDMRREERRIKGIQHLMHEKVCFMGMNLVASTL